MPIKPGDEVVKLDLCRPVGSVRVVEAITSSGLIKLRGGKAPLLRRETERYTNDPAMIAERRQLDAEWEQQQARAAAYNAREDVQLALRIIGLGNLTSWELIEQLGVDRLRQIVAILDQQS